MFGKHTRVGYREMLKVHFPQFEEVGDQPILTVATKGHVHHRNTLNKAIGVLASKEQKSVEWVDIAWDSKKGAKAMLEELVETKGKITRYCSFCFSTLF